MAFRPAWYRFVRFDNEQFSSYNITVGESITVTGELRSLVNRELGVTFVPLIDKDRVIAVMGDPEFFSKCSPCPIPVSDVGKMAASEWSVVRAPYSADPRARISLEPGATVPFSVEVRSTNSGAFRLATAYVVEDMIVYLGRGATIHVQPTQTQLQKCAELGIPEQECSDRAILHDSYWIITFPFQYMIGIGAAIAGAVAFVMLKRRRR